MSRIVSTITSAVLNSSALKASLILMICVNMVCGPVVASSTLPVRFTHKAPAAVPAKDRTAVNVSEEKKRELIEQKNIGHVPLNFEANTGQTDARVKFLSRGSNYGLYLTSDEALMVFSSQSQQANKTRNAHSTRQREVVRMKLIGAAANANLTGMDQLPGKTNYFLGNDPAKWRTDVANYRKVKYEQIYPGIDLVYYGNSDRQIEYDFLVAPNADPTNIKLKFNGVARVRLDRKGDLLLTTKTGTLRHRKPVIYQDVKGTRTPVEGGYVVGTNGQVSFRLGRYDRTRSLIIDPVIVYSTYLGGSDLDEGFSIALDSSNNIYIAGITDSTNFPLENPFQSINKGGNGPVDYYELYVSKLDPTGQALIYSTYLGGTGIDRGGAIAVDNDGNLHITGSTTSLDFPVANAYQSTYGGGASDAFLTKLSPSGNFLIYSTYLGGNGPNWLPGNYYEAGNVITFDNVGNAYLAGETDSFGFPVLQPIKAANGGTSSTSDAFLLKMSTAGTLLFSTYLGGNNGDDAVQGMTTDAAGNIYLAGSTASTDFPIVNAPSYLTQNANQYNAFVMKIPADLSSITYSTMIGGSDSDSAGSIVVDASQNIYLGGNTYSQDFPVVNAFQPTNPITYVYGNPRSAGWIMKLQSDFTVANYSTYLGGSEASGVASIALDPSNILWVYGFTLATNFPVVDAIYTANRGYEDVTLSKFSPDGSTLTFSSYLGGNAYDRPGRMVLNSDGEIYLSGNTGSSNLPLQNPYQSVYGGGASDAFIMKIAPQNGLLTISGTVTDGYGKGMGGVTVSITGSVSKSSPTLPNGRYLFSVASGGNYTVTATKAPLSFLPASQTFNSLGTNQVANFAVTNRNLSGRITDVVGSGVPGITVALSGSYSLSVQSDLNGFYSIIAPSGGSYTLTPSSTTLLATYVFTPATRTITNLSADTTGLDFSSSITYLESFFPIADAHVEEGATANQNFGTATQMRLQTKNGSTRDIYFKFDVSGLSRKILNAKLRVYGSSTGGSVTNAAYGVGSSSWIESGPGGITWNTAPPRLGQIPNATTTIWAYTSYDIDVTSYVISEIAAGRSVFSLALHNPSNSSSSYDNVTSREQVRDRPELRITTGDDNRAPSVSLTAPADGTLFTAPANIPLTATASDSDGTISKVEFFAGTSLVGTAPAAPYTVTWSNVSPGSYQLFAVATDNSGGTTTTTGINVTVNNGNNSPVVTLNTPVNGTTFPAGTNISLAATAYDPDGVVNKVEFFAGTTLVGTATVPVNGLYTAVWNNVNAGAYSLTAKATDNANGVQTSNAASISVVSETGLSPAADTYVRDGSSAATNFGTATELQTQLSATTGSNRESYLKFNLATASGITRARLRLFGRLSDTSGTNVPLGVYSSTNTGWSETTITWNTKLTLDATLQAQATITDNVARWYEFDVTSYIKQEKNNSHDLVTLAVKGLSNSSPYVTFNSKESTLATDNRPQLLLWTTQPRTALLVVGSSNLNAGDNAAKTRLQNLGFTVTTKVASNQLVTADADGKAIVVISSTATASSVTNKFRYVAVPVVVWEFDVFDDMGMTGTTAADFGQTTTAQTALQIINSTHPLAAGLSNQPVVASPGTNFSWGNPNVNAAKIATVVNDANKVVIFGYDKGGAMPGLNAPARRVGLFMTDVTAGNFNTNGGLLFDAAIKWATEVITVPVIYTLSPASGPAGTSVVLAGLNFGSSQGTSSLTFNGVPVTAGAWTDKSITASVPFYATTGPVVVTVSGVASNSLVFVVGDTDVDGDGLPDWWEMQYFGNLNQTANGDPDGDGLTNLQEFQQGRNPTKSALPDANGSVDLKIYTPLVSPTP